MTPDDIASFLTEDPDVLCENKVQTVLKVLSGLGIIASSYMLHEIYNLTQRDAKVRSAIENIKLPKNKLSETQLEQYSKEIDAIEMEIMRQQIERMRSEVKEISRNINVQR